MYILISSSKHRRLATMKNTFEQRLNELRTEAFRLSRALDLPYTRNFTDRELKEKIDNMSYAFIANFVEFHSKEV